MAEPKPSKPTNGAMRVDTDLVRELAELLSQNALTEIEVEDGDRKIKVRREAAPLIAAAHHAPAVAAPAAAATAPLAAPADDVPANAVKSPMVGTAFLSPQPGSPPFVAVGDTVKAGETLLIIEAMKVMNPIRAPRGGRVARVLVENGSPVEYGQVMMVID